MNKNPILEELLLRWKMFMAASFAAAILGYYLPGYLQKVEERWNSFDERKERAELGRTRKDDIKYSYLGNDGFELELDTGDLNYYFAFDGACRDQLHAFAGGNRLSIYKGLNRVHLYDRNCDNLIDVVRSENGGCSTEADENPSHESCSHRTYEDANMMHNRAVRLLHVREFAHDYYEKRYNTPELPEDQMERLLKGFRKQAP